MKKHRLKNLAASLITCLVLFTTIAHPMTALAAYEQITTQVTIDDANWQIVAGVVSETVGMNGQVNESIRVGSSALDSLAGNNGDPGVGAGLLSNLNIASVDQPGYGDESVKKTNLVLSFPGKTRSSWNMREDSTEYDKARANTVKDILLYSFNSAYNIIYGTSKPDSLETYRSNVVALLNAASSVSSGGSQDISADGKTYTVSPATSSDVSSFDDDSMKLSDYLTIASGDQRYTFAYRIPKGYVSISGRTENIEKTLQHTTSSSEDASYITWGEFAYEAFATYILDEKHGLDSSAVYSKEPGAFEQILVDLCSSLANTVTNLLGLWSMDELVLNSGVRGGSGYVGGVFPASWEPTIWTFFYIMEVLSLIILSFAILAGIYKRAMSTVNPIVRASFMEQLKNICISIFVLILLPIIFRLLLSTSATLTEISVSALGEQSAKERFAALTKNSGTLGGCIMQFVYLASLIYFNFFYYLRSLIVMALIILSPILVMAYAIGDNWKGITKEMFKVFISSVFIQPIQALCLVMILLLPVDGRGFQSIIAIYALIPLTNMIKDITFNGGGGGGGGLASAAQRGAGNTTSKLKAAGLVAAAGGFAAGSAAIGGTMEGIRNRMGGGEEGGSSTGEAGNSGKASRAEQEAERENSQNNGGTGGGAGDNGGGERAGGEFGGGSYENAGGGSASNNDSEGRGGFRGFVDKVSETASRVGQNPGVRVAGRVMKGAAGVACAGLGGSLSALGFRNNLQQVGKGALSSAIVSGGAAPTGGYENENPGGSYENENAGGGGNYENENVGGGNGGNYENENTGNDGDNATPEPPPLTPVDLGRNYADGNASAEDLASLEQTDLTNMDGMIVNSNGSEFKGNDEALGNAGVYVARPEKGDSGKPDWTHNRSIDYSAAQLSQADTANLAAMEQVFNSGDEAKIDSLRNSGIENVSANYQNVGGKRELVGYSMNVNDTKALKSNYNIDMNAKWRNRDGSTAHGMATTSGSFVPNVVNNSKVNLTGGETTQPSPTPNPSPTPTPSPAQENAQKPDNDFDVPEPDNTIYPEDM